MSAPESYGFNRTWRGNERVGVVLGERRITVGAAGFFAVQNMLGSGRGGGLSRKDIIIFGVVIPILFAWALITVTMWFGGFPDGFEYMYGARLTRWNDDPTLVQVFHAQWNFLVWMWPTIHDIREGFSLVYDFLSHKITRIY